MFLLPLLRFFRDPAVWGLPPGLEFQERGCWIFFASHRVMARQDTLAPLCFNGHVLTKLPCRSAFPAAWVFA